MAQNVMAYPFLIDSALHAVPSLYAAGAETRLQLIEIVVNIHRDAETFEAIRWAMLWGSEVARAYPENRDIRRIKARRTMAHALQVHGFPVLAQKHLTACEALLTRDFVGHPEFQTELGDIRHRALCAQLAVGVHGSPRALTSALAAVEQTPGPAGAVRDRLHVRSLEVQQRRLSGARAKGPGYEDAVADAFAELPGTDGAHRYGLLDAILHAAIRVGDKQALDHVLDGGRLEAPAQWANLGFRIEGRVERARRRFAGLPSAAEVGAVTSSHPLRLGVRVASDLNAAV